MLRTNAITTPLSVVREYLIHLNGVVIGYYLYDLVYLNSIWPDFNIHFYTVFECLFSIQITTQNNAKNNFKIDWIPWGEIIAKMTGVMAPTKDRPHQGILQALFHGGFDGRFDGFAAN